MAALLDRAIKNLYTKNTGMIYVNTSVQPGS